MIREGEAAQPSTNPTTSRPKSLIKALTRAPTKAPRDPTKVHTKALAKKKKASSGGTAVATVEMQRRKGGTNIYTLYRVLCPILEIKCTAIIVITPCVYIFLPIAKLVSKKIKRTRSGPTDGTSMPTWMWFSYCKAVVALLSTVACH
jgi:hypothetical protein